MQQGQHLPARFPWSPRHMPAWLLIAPLLALFSFLPGGATSVHAATISQFNAFWRQENAADFAAWTANGVALNASLPALQLAPSSTSLT
ncbi:MAG: hypothetical protein J2P36_30760, partial [Ktedonobacteraceae bacterium]|nr:hypothetical protein [Ktedonobacteraceae bacterium]